jgi:hypothetical protein
MVLETGKKRGQFLRRNLVGTTAMLIVRIILTNILLILLEALVLMVLLQNMRNVRLLQAAAG